MGENFFIMSLGFYFHSPAARELFIGTYKEDGQWMNLYYLRHGFLQPLTLFTIKSIVGSYVGNTVIHPLQKWWKLFEMYWWDVYYYYSIYLVCGTVQSSNV